MLKIYKLFNIKYRGNNAFDNQVPLQCHVKYVKNIY